MKVSAYHSARAPKATDVVRASSSSSKQAQYITINLSSLLTKSVITVFAVFALNASNASVLAMGFLPDINIMPDFVTQVAKLMPGAFQNDEQEAGNDDDEAVEEDNDSDDTVVEESEEQFSIQIESVEETENDVVTNDEGGQLAVDQEAEVFVEEDITLTADNDTSLGIDLSGRISRRTLIDSNNRDNKERENLTKVSQIVRYAKEEIEDENLPINRDDLFNEALPVNPLYRTTPYQPVGTPEQRRNYYLKNEFLEQYAIDTQAITNTIISAVQNITANNNTNIDISFGDGALNANININATADINNAQDIDGTTTNTIEDIDVTYGSGDDDDTDTDTDSDSGDTETTSNGSDDSGDTSTDPVDGFNSSSYEEDREFLHEDLDLPNPDVNNGPSGNIPGADPFMDDIMDQADAVTGDDL